MKKINYTMATGEVVRIEVSDEFADAYEEIDKNFIRNEEKFIWRARMKETSYEKFNEETGFEAKDKSIPTDEQVLQTQFIESFMTLLTEYQKVVFKKIYMDDLPLRTVANQLNVTLKTIQECNQAIQKKFLKKFLKIPRQKSTSHSYIVKGDDL